VGFDDVLADIEPETEAPSPLCGSSPVALEQVRDFIV
jgi:hypothetical protein